MAKRVDDQGRAFKGSQLQIQIAVNRHQRELDRAILAALPTLAEHDPVLEWCSPRGDDSRPFREYWDGSLLERLGRVELLPHLKEFWPARGPHWDAVAVARTRAGRMLGPVLVEAKSHPGELRSQCKAKGERRRRIESSLSDTRSEYGGSSEHAEAWIARFYQAANRLTFLRWWNEELSELAWLANVYFVEDPSRPGLATTCEKWRTAIEKSRTALGVAETDVPHAGAVFLRGWERAELVGGT